ncbi:MAG: MBL fold metallo-hydrolase [Albidovulum sp.]
MAPQDQILALGTSQITVLSDGWTEMGNEIFPDFDPACLDYEPTPTIRLEIAAFLIRHAGRVVLVDTGSDDGMGDRAGRFHQSLAAANCAPGDIDQIVITHLHGDHYGGLLTPEGQVAFPRARLIMSKAEYRHKHDADVYAELPSQKRASIDRARSAVAPYAGRIDLVQDGDSIAPGLSVMALPGHTPGHIGLSLTSGDMAVLIWGDLVHYPAYQMANPDWSVIYDTDPDQAAETRKKMLVKAAQDHSLILGSHLGARGFSRVVADGQGFRLVSA